MDKSSVPVDKENFAPVLDERRRERNAQQQVALGRLAAHQRIGVQLLGDLEQRKSLLDAAQSEVRRWAERRLCSQDYIDRWTEWLALPPAELVERMCADADGWGNAMRQNSPFTAARPAAAGPAPRRARTGAPS